VILANHDFYRTVQLILVLSLWSLLLGASVLPPGDKTERVRAFTRDVEFDFLDWSMDAFILKYNQASLGTKDYLSDEQNVEILLDTIDLVREIQRREAELNAIFADPNIDDPHIASAELRLELETLEEERDQFALLAESILQNQLMSTLADLGMTFAGQSIPPVLYHSTPLPNALIVSPRDVIRQDNNISISPGLTLEERIALEEKVAKSLDVSTLVVPIGGVGTYPTMIAQTSNLNWLAEVVAHEWTHNFFTLRPLGVNFFASPAMRTINETAANIAGKEMGRALIAEFYPEFLPPEPPPITPSPQEEEAEPEPPEEPVFDFNAEMRITRVTADELLLEGKIEEAEAYMEERRQFLWDNGYRIRKLNQAYFAFFGAYADRPGGAAGDDPVGDAVRRLRSQSSTLAEFMNQISWISSFEELQVVLGEGEDKGD
jgi:hypothetical protein